jgi:hypothetical protein
VHVRVFENWKLCLSVTRKTIITLKDVYLSLSIRFDTYLDAWAPI